jgi:hypothetical protein
MADVFHAIYQPFVSILYQLEHQYLGYVFHQQLIAG